MSNRVLLTEATASAPTKKGSRWRVICARPGQGSSGFYTPELFKEYGHIAVPPGAQSYIQHDPSRNVKDMIGTFPEGAYWDEDEQALVAELEVFSHWKDFVEEVGPHAGMSLFAMGEKDEEDNVTAFHEDAYNGVDLVGRPGLKGSGIQELLEVAQAASGKEPSVNAAQEGKENMEIKELAEKLDKLTETVSTLVSTLTEKAKEDAQVEVDAKAVTEALTAFEGRVATINKAEDLTVSQRESLMEAAKQPEADVDALIEASQKITKEIRESLKPNDNDDAAGGRVITEGAEVKYGAWK